MILDPTAADHIRKLLKSRHVRLYERNIRQAEVPDSCQVLANHSGSAPGMMFRKHDKIFVSLPGVPFEMKDIFEHELLPVLQREFILPLRKHRTLLLEGVPESLAAEKLSQWEEQLPDSMNLAYLPSVGILRLRISISGDNEDYLNEKLNKATKELNQLFGSQRIFGEGTDTLQEIIGRLLVKEGASLSTAESCTGGTIAQMITSVPGASEYFAGSVIAYSNEIKIKQLGVAEADLKNY